MWPFSSKDSVVGNGEWSDAPPVKFVADPPAPCKECGVLVEPSKLKLQLEVTITVTESGASCSGVTHGRYCSRCVPKAQLSLHLTNAKGVVDETRSFTFSEGWIQDLDSEGNNRWLVSEDIYMGILCEWCCEPTDSTYTYEGKRYCNDHRTKQGRGG